MTDYLISISSANWTLEPCSLVKDTLYICSNSQVHLVKVSDGQFTYLRSVRPRGKQIRCITCIDETQIIIQSDKNNPNQVVSIQHGGPVEMIWDTRTVSACCRDVVAYDDGTARIKQKIVKLQDKITGLVWLRDVLWIAQSNGTISLVQNYEVVSTLKMPDCQKQSLNLKAFRLAICKTCDGVDVIIIAGNNGDLYTYAVKGDQNPSQQEFEAGLVKSSDNPHCMPVIQILGSSERNQFITVGYDRVICHWEVLIGGHFVENLGSIATLSSTVLEMSCQGSLLYFAQPNKIVISKIDTSHIQTKQFVLPPIPIVQICLCPFIDGLILVRFESKIQVYMAHSQEIIVQFKVKTLHAMFVLSAQTPKIDCTRESQSMINQGFDLVTLQQLEGNYYIKFMFSKTSIKCPPAKSFFICGERFILVNEGEVTFLSAVPRFVQGNAILFVNSKIVIQHNLMLLANDLSGQLATLKLEQKIIQACELPHSMAACLNDSQQLLIIDLADVALKSGKIIIIKQLKLKLPFKTTSITSSDKFLFFALDSKCVKQIGLVELMSEPEPKQNETEKRQKTDIQTLFGIVRSRVFFQQKGVDTAKITACILENTEMEAIDLKILRWSDVDNREDVAKVIAMELQSCVHVGRFEFYQKMLVLNVWLVLLGMQEMKVAIELYEQNKSKFAGIHFNHAFELIGSGQNDIEPGDQTFHIEMICLVRKGEASKAIAQYSEQGFLTEALLLCKAFGMRDVFISCVEFAQAKFMAAKDRQGQGLKLQAALSQLK